MPADGEADTTAHGDRFKQFPASRMSSAGAKRRRRLKHITARILRPRRSKSRRKRFDCCVGVSSRASDSGRRPGNPPETLRNRRDRRLSVFTYTAEDPLQRAASQVNALMACRQKGQVLVSESFGTGTCRYQPYHFHMQAQTTIKS